VFVTSFTFTAEQIRSAPSEVRLWFEHEIAANFRSLTTTAPAPAHSSELAVRVFELIRNDFATTQVFLELGREPPIPNAAPLHALGIGEIKRHLRLGDDRLADCFSVIKRSFMQVRNDPDVALFGFDQANHVYIHEMTHHSIRSLWEELVQLSSETLPAPAAGGSHPFGFVPRVVGPSEDIAAH
jgi:hypothetical protein